MIVAQQGKYFMLERHGETFIPLIIIFFRRAYGIRAIEGCSKYWIVLSQY